MGRAASRFVGKEEREGRGGDGNWLMVCWNLGKENGMGMVMGREGWL
jgi:hypothetical protein